jgi:hypothetical protein
LNYCFIDRCHFCGRFISATWAELEDETRCPNCIDKPAPEPEPDWAIELAERFSAGLIPVEQREQVAQLLARPDIAARVERARQPKQPTQPYVEPRNTWTKGGPHDD